MQSQTPTNPQRISAVLRQTRLASCLALALSLSTGVRNSVAGERGPEQPSPLALRTSKVSQGALEPGVVFANIQKWRADHPRPQPLATTVPGSTHVVTNCNNEGAGSLRETVGNAASGDIIDMSSLDCGVIVLDQFLPIGQDNLTLRGSIVSGAPRPSIQPSDSGANTTGLLVHYGAGTLTVDSLWLRSGTKYNDGGCVRSEGNVTIGRSMVTDCKAGSTDTVSRGGAIYAAGMVMLVESVVSHNCACSDVGNSSGGGIYANTEFRSKYSVVSHNSAGGIGGMLDEQSDSAGGIFSGGTTIVIGSTIYDNHADVIGGLRTRGTGDIHIQSSTISGNSSVYLAALTLDTNGGTITITDTTVTDNYPALFETYLHTVGLRIGGSPRSVTVSNSIVSGSRRSYEGYAADFVAGVVVSSNHNLIGEHAGNMPTHIHQVNTPLGPLMDNGGPTPTHAIGTGSWAFNRGQTSQTQDQRGMPRPVGTGDDIGAFESDALFIGRFEEPPLG